MASVDTATSVRRGEFRGNASEYFGIWIVNILLTIVTFGIYSAWAKVRRNRYFYGNTYLDGHSFDYHAQGRQIFIGRVIVFLILIGINILSAVNVVLAIIAPLAIFAILPLLIARGLRFSARVTSYRNIRFDFVGGAWGAFVAVILGGMVATISIGLLAPFASRWLYRYIFNNLRYGDRSFSTAPALGALYRVFLLPALMFLIGLVVLGFIAFLFVFPMFQDFANQTNDGSEQAQVIIGVIAIYGVAIPLIALYVLVGIFYRIGVRNVVVSATILDGRHFLFSDMSRLRYFWIALSNTVISVVTLGLMRPWAAVREARYKAEHTGVIVAGDIGEVMSSIQTTGSAISAEYMDMEGFDFGF